MRFHVLLTIILILVLLPVPGLSSVNQKSMASSSKNSGVTIAPAAIPNPVRHPLLSGPGSHAVSVTAGYSTEPAPMGIADYGINGLNGSPYEYLTNQSIGNATIVYLDTHSSGAGYEMTFQLNVNLAFNTTNAQYVYWIQDVVIFYNTNNNNTKGGVLFVDNVWNFSSTTAQMSSTGISGNGLVSSSSAGNYYYDYADNIGSFTGTGGYAGDNIYLTYPATITFNVTAGVSSSGKPTVSFAYNDGFGLVTYDKVTFTAVNNLKTIGFEVNGKNYNPAGLWYDSELILGGPGGGTSTADQSSDVRLQLEYWNGHNYEIIPYAYNYGSDTGETISNVLSQWFYYIDNGENIARIQRGSGTLSILYYQSLIGIIDVKSPLTSGFLYISNATDASAVVWRCLFINKEVTVTIYPGYYKLQLYNGTKLYQQGNFTVSTGKILYLQTPLSGSGITLSYSIVGGGSGYSPPQLTYRSGGVSKTVTLTTSPTLYTMDTNTVWNTTTTLSGSSSSERWQTNQQTTGNSSISQTTVFTYYNQFLDTLSYSVIGGGSPIAPTFSATQFGSSYSKSLTTSAAGYWLDSGSSWSETNPLNGSTSTVRWRTSQAASGTVSSSQTIAFTYYHQFLVTASYSTSDGSTPSSSIVLSGKQFGNSTFTLTLTTASQQVWLDANSSLLTNNPVTASSGVERWDAINGTSASSLFSAITIDPTYYHQYLVTASYSTSDGSTPSSSIILSGKQFGNSTFSLALSTSNEQVWLDADSSLSTNNPIIAASGTERWNAVSGTSASSLSSAITFDPKYYHQYFVSFAFKDNSGTNTIIPTSFEIQLNTSVVSVPSFSLWLNSGSAFQIYSVMWESENVKPTSNITYTVNAPLTETILDRVYNAKLVVTDYLGIPISGAQVTFTLANGTIIQSPTGSDGSISINQIPIGTFKASISYLGTTTTVNGDASIQSVTTQKLFLSYPTIILIIAVVVIIIVAAFMLIRRRRRRSRIPPSQPAAPQYPLPPPPPPQPYPTAPPSPPAPAPEAKTTPTQAVPPQPPTFLEEAKEKTPTQVPVAAPTPGATPPPAAAPTPKVAQFCTNCGAQLQQGVKFCTNCGAPTMPQRTTTYQQATPAPQPPQPAQQYPIPPPPPPATPTKVPLCTTCGNPLTYVQQYNRWYCTNCRKYQ